MSTKRPFVHPSRQEQVPDEPSRKRRKENAYPKSAKKARPVNELKSKIRSLKRLLEKYDKLPATVKIEKERELQSAQYELDQTNHAQQRSDMIGRYHKIRFFDKQKATKRLKQARKTLSSFQGEAGERAGLAWKVEDAEIDVNYAQYFPLDQPYVSLFPRKPKQEDAEAVQGGGGEKDGVNERKGDPEMWQLVKQCMTNGTLEQLRNGKLTGKSEVVADVPKKVGKRKAKQEVPVTAHAHARAHVDEAPADDDSDGGFFE